MTGDTSYFNTEQEENPSKTWVFFLNFFQREIKVAMGLGKRKKSESRVRRPSSVPKICDASAFPNVDLSWENTS